VNVFVASFIGSPAMNLVEAILDDDTIEFGGHRIELQPEHRPDAEAGPIVLGIRPECFEDASFADPSLPQLDVEVAVLEELGSDAHVLFRVDATPAGAEETRFASASRAQPRRIPLLRREHRREPAAPAGGVRRHADGLLTPRFSLENLTFRPLFAASGLFYL
jgi:ABC-type sugar transport system ATPase subunit